MALDNKTNVELLISSLRPDELNEFTSPNSQKYITRKNFGVFLNGTEGQQIGINII